jgi:hypothetical protein
VFQRIFTLNKKMAARLAAQVQGGNEPTRGRFRDEDPNHNQNISQSIAVFKQDSFRVDPIHGDKMIYRKSIANMPIVQN